MRDNMSCRGKPPETIEVPLSFKRSRPLLWVTGPITEPTPIKTFSPISVVAVAIVSIALGTVIVISIAFTPPS